MANAKKTISKKAATKAVKTALRKAKEVPYNREAALKHLEFERFYVVSERKLLTWTPIAIFATRDAAAQYASLADEAAGVSFNKFKVDGALFQLAPIHEVGLDTALING
jgi:hypothetical protein